MQNNLVLLIKPEKEEGIGIKGYSIIFFLLIVVLLCLISDLFFYKDTDYSLTKIVLLFYLACFFCHLKYYRGYHYLGNNDFWGIRYKVYSDRILFIKKFFSPNPKIIELKIQDIKEILCTQSYFQKKRNVYTVRFKTKKIFHLHNFSFIDIKNPAPICEKIKELIEVHKSGNA